MQCKITCLYFAARGREHEQDVHLATAHVFGNGRFISKRLGLFWSSPMRHWSILGGENIRVSHGFSLYWFSFTLFCSFGSRIKPRRRTAVNHDCPPNDSLKTPDYSRADSESALQTFRWLMELSARFKQNPEPNSPSPPFLLMKMCLLFVQM